MVCSSSDGRAAIIRGAQGRVLGLALGQAVASRGNGILDRGRFGGSGNGEAGDSARNKVNGGGLYAVHGGDRTLNAGHAASAGQSFNAVFNARFGGRSSEGFSGAATAARRGRGQGQFGA